MDVTVQKRTVTSNQLIVIFLSCFVLLQIYGYGVSTVFIVFPIIYVGICDCCGKSACWSKAGHDWTQMDTNLNNTLSTLLKTDTQTYQYYWYYEKKPFKIWINVYLFYVLVQCLHTLIITNINLSVVLQHHTDQ